MNISTETGLYLTLLDCFLRSWCRTSAPDHGVGGSDAPAPAPLDCIVKRRYHEAVWNEGFHEHPKQDVGCGAGRLCSAAEHPGRVYDMAVACPARDPQHARHRAPTRTEVCGDWQGLSLPPRPVDEQRRRRQGDPWEAGEQVRHVASLARDIISLSITPASSPIPFHRRPNG